MTSLARRPLLERTAAPFPANLSNLLPISIRGQDFSKFRPMRRETRRIHLHCCGASMLYGLGFASMI